MFCTTPQRIIVSFNIFLATFPNLFKQKMKISFLNIFVKKKILANIIMSVCTYYISRLCEFPLTSLLIEHRDCNIFSLLNVIKTQRPALEYINIYMNKHCLAASSMLVSGPVKVTGNH